MEMLEREAARGVPPTCATAASRCSSASSLSRVTRSSAAWHEGVRGESKARALQEAAKQMPLDSLLRAQAAPKQKQHVHKQLQNLYQPTHLQLGLCYDVRGRLAKGLLEALHLRQKEKQQGRKQQMR
jgi:hypothetical protein